jgi:hypothetical protein
LLLLGAMHAQMQVMRRGTGGRLRKHLCHWICPGSEEMLECYLHAAHRKMVR